MNQLVQSERLGSQVAMTNSAGGFAVTPQTLSDIVEFARFMCQSNAGIPAFLRGNGPDCAAVIMQAMKWGFDPFSVAQKSYKVKDIIAYEAQLIAAVINARSGIKGRLRYQFDGNGNELTCTVSGILDGVECTYTSPPVGSITTKNSPLWKTDPQQQLGYYSARNWARRHCPEVILGAYDRDEAEEFRGPERAKNITPEFDPLSDEPPVAKRAIIESEPEPEHTQSSDTSTDDGSENVTTSGVDDPAADSSAPTGDEEADDTGADHGDAASSASEPQYSPADCLKAFMTTATDPALSVPERRDLLEQSKEWWKKALPSNLEFVKSCLTTADKVAKGELGADAARRYLEGLL